MIDLRQQISDALTAFTQRPLADAAIALFETLGYRSEKRLGMRVAEKAPKRRAHLAPRCFADETTQAANRRGPSCL